MTSVTAPVVLLTGASRGIGLATARALLSRGACVVGVGRSAPEGLPDLHALVREHPDSFHYAVADLAVPGSAKSVFDACTARFGRIDALVHNAGSLGQTALVASHGIDVWRQIMELNFFAGVELVQLALPLLRENNGRIVFVSSGLATRVHEGVVPYSTTKAAVNMFIAGLAAEEPKIVAVAVRPGIVNTAMVGQVVNQGKQGMGDDAHDRFVQIVKERMVEPEEPAASIANLALRAPESLSGKFCSWNDREVEALEQKSQ